MYKRTHSMTHTMCKMETEIIYMEGGSKTWRETVTGDLIQGEDFGEM